MTDRKDQMIAVNLHNMGPAFEIGFQFDTVQMPVAGSKSDKFCVKDHFSAVLNDLFAHILNDTAKYIGSKMWFI